MHQRNRYRDGLNFEELYESRLDLQPYFSRNPISGKLKYNFCLPEALRAITIALLERDFSLKLEIPTNRLIPALPLRLNYIHWIEDLLEHFCFSENPTNTVGIDIGSGASCIYPILSCTIHPDWKFIACESEPENIDISRNNLTINGITDKIQIVDCSNTDGSFNSLMNGLKASNELSPLPERIFIMCNPPFFEVPFKAQSYRKRKYHCSESDIECYVDGGELKFVKEMIDGWKEILEFSNGIPILFTSMFGCKDNFQRFVKHLKQNHPSVLLKSSTVFRQGRKSRWAIACCFFQDHWKERISVFQNEDISAQIPPISVSTSLQFELPKLKSFHLNDFRGFLTRQFNLLNLQVIGMDVGAHENIIYKLGFDPSLGNCWNRRFRRSKELGNSQIDQSKPIENVITFELHVSEKSTLIMVSLVSQSSIKNVSSSNTIQSLFHHMKHKIVSFFRI